MITLLESIRCSTKPQGYLNIVNSQVFFVCLFQCLFIPLFVYSIFNSASHVYKFHFATGIGEGIHELLSLKQL